MKILQVASFYAPVVGGMETVLRDLAEGLTAAGDHVVVLSSSTGLRGVHETANGVELVRSPSLGKVYSQPLTPWLPVALRRLSSQCDVVHLHMPNPLAEAATAMLPPSVPIVVTYHCDIVRQRVLKPFYGPIRQAILGRARRIVVATENHIRFSEVLPAFADKCTIVPFGISPKNYELDAHGRELALQLRARHGRFVLFVGRLVYYKGVRYLIESMKDIDATLVIAGDGPLRGALEAQAHASGLGSRVIFVGSQSRRDLSALLEACAILVLPSVSRSEGFGVTLLEGMLFAKPLITTRLPSGVALVNEDGRTGIQVAPNDHLDLAAAIKKLLSDEALSTAMGSAGRAKVAERFALEKMVAGYRDIYSQVLGP